MDEADFCVTILGIFLASCLKASRSNVTSGIKVNRPNTDVKNALLLKYITYLKKT